MGKFYGEVCYSDSVETSPGIFRNAEKIVKYYGDTQELRSGWVSQSNSTLDNCTMNLTIRICADAYAYENWQKIKWVNYNGVKLKVTGVTPKRPRLVLSVGGVYLEDSN